MSVTFYLVTLCLVTLYLVGDPLLNNKNDTVYHVIEIVDDGGSFKPTGLVQDSFEEFQEKVREVTKEYTTIGFTIWRSFLFSLVPYTPHCLQVLLSRYTPLHHLHMCFELSHSESDEHLYLTFEKNKNSITFSLSKEKEMVKHYGFVENGNWKLEERKALKEEYGRTYPWPEEDPMPTIRAIMDADSIWKNPIAPTFRERALSIWARFWNGSGDCFKGTYNLLDCNCQIFVVQLYKRMRMVAAKTTVPQTCFASSDHLKPE
jgi:hypothetical protein